MAHKHPLRRLRCSHASSGPGDREDPSSLSAAVLSRSNAHPRASQMSLQLDNSLRRLQLVLGQVSSSRYSCAKAFCLAQLSPEPSRYKDRGRCPCQSIVRAAGDSEHPTATAGATCPSEDLPNRPERSCALIGTRRRLSHRIHAPILLMMEFRQCHLRERSSLTLYRRSW